MNDCIYVQPKGYLANLLILYHLTGCKAAFHKVKIALIDGCLYSLSVSEPYYLILFYTVYILNLTCYIEMKHFWKIHKEKKPYNLDGESGCYWVWLSELKPVRTWVSDGDSDVKNRI